MAIHEVIILPLIHSVYNAACYKKKSRKKRDNGSNKVQLVRKERKRESQREAGACKRQMFHLARLTNEFRSQSPCDLPKKKVID